jgi:predicted TIM-barrel fold metal-dependent hydrolase
MHEVIDCHINITKNGTWGDTSHDASLESLLIQMEQSKISKALLLPVEGYCDKDYVSEVVKSYPNKFIGFGNFSCCTAKKDIENCADLGLRGVKFHPRVQKTSLKDLVKSGALEILEQLNLPLMICGWLQSKDLPIDDLSPLQVDRIAKLYPNLKLILSHLGCHKYWDAFFVARSNQNVYLDCSYYLEFFKGTSLIDDFYNSLPLIDQKIIFGSDFPEVDMKTYLDDFLLRVDPEKVNIPSVLSENFKKVLAE